MSLQLKPPDPRPSDARRAFPRHTRVVIRLHQASSLLRTGTRTPHHGLVPPAWELCIGTEACAPPPLSLAHTLPAKQRTAGNPTN